MQKTNGKDWFIRLLKGAAVGIGGILPGLSGGVLAVIFGIYDKLLAFLGNITKNTKTNLRYFLPVAIGAIVGLVFFSAIVEQAFGAHQALFTCLFIGFVVGTLPSLFKQAGREGRATSDYIILVISAVILIMLMVIGGQSFTTVASSFLVWILSGAIVGLGVIVPGLSPSNFLIYFGLYDKMADGISAFDFDVILPLLLGLIICVVGLAKLANWAFNHYYAKMYHLILGTVIGSSIAIIPTVVFPALKPNAVAVSGIALMPTIILMVILFIVGAIFSYWFSGVEEKVNK